MLYFKVKFTKIKCFTLFVTIIILLTMEVQARDRGHRDWHVGSRRKIIPPKVYAIFLVGKRKNPAGALLLPVRD